MMDVRERGVGWPRGTSRRTNAMVISRIESDHGLVAIESSQSSDESRAIAGTIDSSGIWSQGLSRTMEWNGEHWRMAMMSITFGQAVMTPGLYQLRVNALTASDPNEMIVGHTPPSLTS